jgi:hypothetical protein
MSQSSLVGLKKTMMWRLMITNKRTNGFLGFLVLEQQTKQVHSYIFGYFGENHSVVDSQLSGPLSGRLDIHLVK